MKKTVIEIMSLSNSCDIYTGLFSLFFYRCVKQLMLHKKLLEIIAKALGGESFKQLDRNHSMELIGCYYSMLLGKLIS